MTEGQIVETTPERSATKQQGDVSAQSAPSAPPAPTRSRKLLPAIIVFGVLLVAAIVVWEEFFAAPAVPPSIVTVSGRIEGDDSAVAPKTEGRILEVRVREGDSVKAGDVIAVLDDAQVRDRETAARAALSFAQLTSQKEDEAIIPIGSGEVW